MKRFFRIAKFRLHCFSKRTAEIWNGVLLQIILLTWLTQFILLYFFNKSDLDLAWYIYWATEGVATLLLGILVHRSLRGTRFASSGTFILLFLLVNCIGNFGGRVEHSMAYNLFWNLFLIVGGVVNLLHTISAARYARR